MEANRIDNSLDQVVDWVVQGQVGGFFQGSPEMGSRALGNRSIIADPRRKNGKDEVNQVKGREWYRPFAASILLEEVHNWFDMGVLEESPWMLYAVPVKVSKASQIPAVIHVDGTCRIQTVTEESNKEYYHLLKKFHEKTGVPILLNTSLNLGGDPLTHTKEDARKMLSISALDFMYFADEGLLEA